MNITKITTEANTKYDPFLVETLVKLDKTDDSKNVKNVDKLDWSSQILKEGISKLENSIQSNEDTSPLSYKSAPPVETMQEAKKVLSEINLDDLTKNVNSIFNNLNPERISNLFIEESNSVI